MSYAFAAYTIVIVGVLGYAGWLAGQRRALARELSARRETNRG